MKNKAELLTLKELRALHFQIVDYQSTEPIEKLFNEIERLSNIIRETLNNMYIFIFLGVI